MDLKQTSTHKHTQCAALKDGVWSFSLILSQSDWLPFATDTTANQSRPRHQTPCNYLNVSFRCRQPTRSTNKKADYITKLEARVCWRGTESEMWLPVLILHRRIMSPRIGGLTLVSELLMTPVHVSSGDFTSSLLIYENIQRLITTCPVVTESSAHEYIFSHKAEREIGNLCLRASCWKRRRQTASGVLPIGP